MPRSSVPGMSPSEDAPILAAIREAVRAVILLDRAEGPAVVERGLALYRSHLLELAGPENAFEAVDQLVSFAAQVLQDLGPRAGVEPLQYLQSITTRPRD